MKTHPALAALVSLALAGCSSSPGNIYVRVAHLSPNAPAVDFCVQLGTGNYTGPVLKGLGNTAGLSYTQVSAYVALAPGQYTVKIVAPNAADCSTALANLPTYTLPNLTEGTYATAAAIGLVGSNTTGFTVKPFIDEVTTPAGKAGLRFIHTSPGTPAVDVGVLSGTTFTGVFNDVSYPNTAAAGNGIDANGYANPAPITGATLAAQVTAAPGTFPLTIANVTIPAGQVDTVFAIGILGNATTPLDTLVCEDTVANPAAATLSLCTVTPAPR